MNVFIFWGHNCLAQSSLILCRSGGRFKPTGSSGCVAAAAKNVMGGNPGYGGPRKLVLKKESATPKSAQLPVRPRMQLIQAIGDAGA